MVQILEQHARIIGEVITELVDMHGHPINSTRKKNTITTAQLALVANWYAGTNPASPNYIAVGNAAATLWDSTHATGGIALTNSGSNQEIGQGFEVAVATSVNNVLLWLQRIGTSPGNLVVQIRNDDGAGKPGNTILGTSEQEAINALQASSVGYDWATFVFDTPVVLTVGVQYHLVVVAAGYTYSAAVTEVDVGVDTTTHTYASGNPTQYNGSTFTAIASTDVVFRVTALPTADFTALTAEQAGTRLALTSKTVQGQTAARLLLTYTASQAVGHWNEIGLFNAASGPTMAAVAAIDIKKPNTNGLNVYWIITIN